MSNRSNISLVGNTTTGQNLGGGMGIFSGKNNGNNLQFKSLSAGTGIIMSSQANTVTICSTGGGGSITGGANGLSTSSANIILGGPLTGNTTIETNTHSFCVCGISTSTISLSSGINGTDYLWLGVGSNDVELANGYGAGMYVCQGNVCLDNDSCHKVTKRTNHRGIQSSR